MLPKGVCHVIGAGKVGIDGVVPLCIIYLVKLNRADPSRIVDKNGDIANLFKDLCNSSLNALGIGDVHLIEVVSFSKLLDKLLTCLFIASTNHYMATTRNDAFGNLCANARGATGNQRNFPSKIKCHTSHSSTFSCD